ncbi:MAG: PaaI family thioesterase, partial [Chloroflexi bacterium]|nr:PaaI family thioesterase [Chloroflexota bacterium]
MSEPDLETRLAFVREFAQTSPYYKSMGMTLAEVGDGHAVLRLEIQAQHLNADGILHGGVLPAIADGAMGNALRTIRGEGSQVFTAEVNLQFLRPVTGGT